MVLQTLATALFFVLGYLSWQSLMSLNISQPNQELERCIQCLYSLTQQLVLHFFSTESMSSRRRKTSSSYGATSFTDLFAVLPIVCSQSISFKEPDKPFIAPLPGDPIKRLQQCGVSGSAIITVASWLKNICIIWERIQNYQYTKPIEHILKVLLIVQVLSITFYFERLGYFPGLVSCMHQDKSAA